MGRWQYIFVHQICQFSGHPLVATGKFHQLAVQSWPSRREIPVWTALTTPQPGFKDLWQKLLFTVEPKLSQHCDQLKEVLWWKPCHKSNWKKPTQQPETKQKNPNAIKNPAVFNCAHLSDDKVKHSLTKHSRDLQEKVWNTSVFTGTTWIKNRH